MAAELRQTEAEAGVASILVYLEPRWQNRIERLSSIKSSLDGFGYADARGAKTG